MALEDDIKQYAILAREALLRKYSHAKTGIVKGLNEKGRLVITVDGKDIAVRYNGDVYPKAGDKVIYNPETKKVLIEGYTKKKRKKTTEQDLITRDEQRIAQIKEQDAGISDRIRKKKALDGYVPEDVEEGLPFMILTPVRRSLTTGLRVIWIQDVANSRTDSRVVNVGGMIHNFPPGTGSLVKRAKLFIQEPPLTWADFVLANNHFAFNAPGYMDSYLNHTTNPSLTFGDSYFVEDNFALFRTDLIDTIGSFELCAEGPDIPNFTYDIDWNCGSLNPITETKIWGRGFFPDASPGDWFQNFGDCTTDIADLYSIATELPNFGFGWWAWWFGSDSLYLNDIVDVKIKYGTSGTPATLIGSYRSQITGDDYELQGRRAFIFGSDSDLDASTLANSEPISGKAIEDLYSEGSYYIDDEYTSSQLNTDKLIENAVLSFDLTNDYNKKWKDFSLNIAYGKYYPDQDKYYLLDTIANNRESTYEIRWSDLG